MTEAQSLNQIGEIVSWTCPSSVPYQTLKAGLTAAGLDDGMAPEMLPRNAFKRAARELEEGRIIRQVSETETELKFQFTKEYLDKQAGEFEYSKECDLYLRKDTGQITCRDYSLEQKAQDLLSEKLSVRTASDVTRIVQSLFKSNGDLFPLRDQGGVYFVPQEHVALVECVEILMLSIGGKIKRFELASSVHASQSVAVSIRDTLHGLIDDYGVYARQIDSESPKQVETASKRIMEIRTKLEAYRGLLQTFDQEIEQAIKDVTTDLHERIGIEQDEPESQPVAAQPEETGETTAAQLLADLLASI
jgi:hypothetical protein